MPVSASPWGNLLSQQMKSPESFTADRQAVEAGGITNALNTAKLGEYQQGLQRSEQLRNMLSSGAGSDQLMKGGFLKEGMDLAKNNADVGNINAEETGRRVESFAKKAAIMRSSIGSVPTPQAAARYMQQAFADPDMGPVMKQFGTLEDALSEIPNNPNDFRNWQMQASEGIGKLVDHAEKQRTQAETERNNKAQNGIAARNASTAEGQLGVSRQRLNLDQQAPKGHYDSERGTVTDLRTGVAQPVTMGGKPLGPKDKASTVTEGERNAGGYLLRMTEATKLLDKFEKTGTASYGSELAGAVPFVGGMTRRAVMSDDQQLYRQAQEDWVRAKLRKESGASIPPDEMDREIEAYFPMPGEGEKVIAQKRQSRAVANTAMQQSAGRAAAQQNGGASGEWGGGWSITPVEQ